MKTIDRSKPVVVTGATGYVGAWVVKRLLDEGITVHAAVRDPGATEKTKWLDALADGAPGTIVYFESDLLEEGSYAEAMRGCELVFPPRQVPGVSWRDWVTNTTALLIAAGKEYRNPKRSR